MFQKILYIRGEKTKKSFHFTYREEEEKKKKKRKENGVLFETKCL